MKRRILKAPAGYVYDWVISPVIDGVEQHLYSQFISLSRFDKEDNYKLVEVKK